MSHFLIQIILISYSAQIYFKHNNFLSIWKSGKLLPHRTQSWTITHINLGDSQCFSLEWCYFSFNLRDILCWKKFCNCERDFQHTYSSGSQVKCKAPGISYISKAQMFMLLVGSQGKSWISTLSSKGASICPVNFREQRAATSLQCGSDCSFQINCTLESVAFLTFLVAGIFSDGYENNVQLPSEHLAPQVPLRPPVAGAMLLPLAWGVGAEAPVDEPTAGLCWREVLFCGLRNTCEQGYF